MCMNDMSTIVTQDNPLEISSEMAAAFFADDFEENYNILSSLSTSVLDIMIE